MSLRGISWCIIFLGLYNINYGQVAEAVQISGRDFNPESTFRCPESAGTINLVEFDGQSNLTVFPGPIYLCFQDQFKIEHNGDQVFCSDSDPLTLPGIGYAFYKCQPSVTGPSAMNIANDPCIEDNPPSTISPGWWTYRDQINGDAIFRNDGYVQNMFNGGNPEQMWFAPHTFDDFANREAVEDPGDVHVNTSEAFSVIYLNEIQITNKQTGVNGNPLDGSFQIIGGLPEWDGSNYADFGVFKVGDPSVRGTIMGTNFTHNDVVNFSVPEMGRYIIYIEDGVSCGATMEVIFSDTNGTVTINIGNSSDEPGENECISFCVEDFVDVASMQFTIAFDPRIMSYQSLVGINLLGLSESGSFNLTDVDKGIIRVTWFDNTTLGQTLADGDCIFDLCFDIDPNSQPGLCSPISITGSPTAIEITNEIGELILTQNPGDMCVIPESNLIAYPKTCNSAPSSFSGSITFEIYGGTGPYSYDIFGGFSPINGSGIIEGQSIFIGNLAAGNYILNVTDALGGTFQLTNIQIIADDPLMVDLLGTDPSCFNLTNGAISASVSGGEPFNDGSYTYEWSNLIYNTDVLSGLPQGNYSITVTDANGCQANASEYIGKDPLDAAFTINQLPTCEQSNNGDVTVIGSGGTPFPGGEYTFQWASPNSLFQQTDISQNTMVTSGILNVRLIDDIGCQWDESIFIGFEKELEAEIIIDQDLLCAGDSNGIVRINGIFADNSPFDLDNINSNAEPGFFGQNDDGFRGIDLGEGTYNVTMTDELTGCVVDTSFTLIEPEILDLGFSADLDCSSGGGGELNILASGGTPGYNFLWEDGNTDMTRSGLPAGDYKVTVTDANGCSDSIDLALTASASISIDQFVITNIGCQGNTTGEITANVNSSGTMINYQWDWDGPSMTFPNSNTITDLSEGEYYLTVSDENGCMVSDTVELTVGTTFSVDVVQQLPFCNGEPNGTLSAIVTGDGDYSFEWDHPNNDNTELLQQVPPGTYSLTVTELAGCAFDTLITLGDQPTINITLDAVGVASCFNSEDGTASVSVSGGKVDNGRYGFLWSSGEGIPLGMNNISSASMLGANEQFVIVFDEECADTLIFNVDAPDSVLLDSNLSVINNVSCFGDTDGSATIVGAGGTPGYIYFWPDYSLDTPDIDMLSPGYHTYVIADANNCIRTDSILIAEPDSLIATIDLVNTQDLGCSNDEDGVIFVNVDGGNANMSYVYQWTDDVSSTNSANGLGPGGYAITVTDFKGCNDTTSYVLNAPPPIVADIPDPAPPVCFGDQTCISIASVIGGSGPDYRYSVNNGPLFSLDSCVSVFAGVYDIAVFDNTGCSYDTTLTIEQPEELILSLGPDVEIDLGDSTTIIDLVVEGPNPISEIIWDPNSGFDCLDDDCERIVVYPSVNTLYNVNVIDIQGCEASDDLLVTINRSIRVFFPNVFSPNGDGFNDIFNMFTGRGILGIDEFKVFDRWGNQMYQIFNVSPNSGGTEGWDGRFNGRDVGPGVYTYFAIVTLIDNSQARVRGDVTLMR